jgi:hypothetical protein
MQIMNSIRHFNTNLSEFERIWEFVENNLPSFYTKHKVAS